MTTQGFNFYHQRRISARRPRDRPQPRLPVQHLRSDSHRRHRQQHRRQLADHGERPTPSSRASARPTSTIRSPGMVGAPLTTPVSDAQPGNCADGTYTVTTGGATGYGLQARSRRRISSRSAAADALVDQRPRQRPPARQYRGLCHRQLHSSSTASVEHRTPNTPGDASATTQPFGGSPALASSNPGIVLPVYICSSGVNCATARRPHAQPEQPLCRRLRRRSGQRRSAHLLSVRRHPVRQRPHQRGLSRHRRPERQVRRRLGLARRGRLRARQSADHASTAISTSPNLLKAINTGAYNFVNPSLNTRRGAQLRLAGPDDAVALDAGVARRVDHQAAVASCPAARCRSPSAARSVARRWRTTTRTPTSSYLQR